MMTDSIEVAVTALPPGDVPATPAPEAGTATVGESTSAASGSSPSESSAVAAAVAGDGTKTAEQSSTSSSATAPSDSSSSSAVSTDSTTAAESPNAAPAADAGAHEAGVAPAAGGDVPNVAPAVVEPTTESASATSADGAGTTSPIDASSPVEQQVIQNPDASPVPLHMRVAQHLEAIYSLTRDAAEQPVVTVTQEAIGVKQHIAEVLQSIHNGIDVRSGEMVQKLEALFHKL